MNITIILILLFAHWIGDFMLQKEEWAVTKHNNFTNLQKHTAVYTLTISIFVGIWMLLQSEIEFRLISLLLFMLVTSIVHTIIDFITSKITHRLYDKGNMHVFFIVIGLDQLLHYIILILTFNAII